MMQSFMMAGFECTSAEINPGQRLDMLAATQHDIRCRDDYRMIKAELGVTTVREGLSWHQIDQGNDTYYFDRFETMMAIGQTEGIQQIWDLNHFDYPDHLDPYSDEFIHAFALYAKRAVQVMRKYSNQTLFVVPINEISFLSWISADMGYWAPFHHGQREGLRLKKQLIQAAIQAIQAIWEVESNIRFVHPDPFMRRVAVSPASSYAIKHALEFNTIIRFEAWDMLSGKTYPELGGHPRYLDIIGMNYYIHNQEWVITDPQKHGIRHQMMDWDSPDRISLATMIGEVYERYHRPILITETGSYGSYRKPWWERTLQQVDEALALRLPLGGVCIYPVLDRLNSVKFLLPQSGVWDFDQECATCDRIPHEQSLSVIRGYTRLPARTPLSINEEPAGTGYTES